MRRFAARKIKNQNIRIALMQIKDKLTGILRRIEDFFIPPLCVVCDGPLSDSRNDGGGVWLCPSCVDALIKNHEGRAPCPRCACNRRKRECACEFAWDFPFESVYCVYDYDDTLSVIARHVKYYGKSGLAGRIGIISAPLIPADFFSGIDTVIPVPLHRAKLRRRGYNQAERFARGVLAGAGVDGTLLRTDLLTRVKDTETQTRLSREERQENLAGAFAVNGRAAGGLAGARVALVDDIFTTGATTEACAEALLGAGCAAVAVLAMGHD
jgi:ComF family protein